MSKEVKQYIKASTSSGKEFEDAIEVMLKGEGIDYDPQPKSYPGTVSAAITPDFKIPLKNGKILWVFAQQAFYGGGQQNDRFDHVIQMDKFVWNENQMDKVFYALKDPYLKSESIEKKLKDKQLYRNKKIQGLRSRRIVGAKEVILEIYNNETLS